VKAAAFDVAAVGSLAQARAALLAEPEARLIAGGQSLGPMLNLRLARPSRLVPIGGLAELAGASETAEAITLGAGITHSAIADGRTPDFAGGLLAGIAEGIAYRAVRNRGTIGGSLCHADPAADWPCTLLALGASVVIDGARRMPLAAFLQGAFQVALAPGEVLTAVIIPRPSPTARWGYVKSCRKPGEFAHAMAAVLLDPARGLRRAVIGATGGAPLLLEGDADPAAALGASGLDALTRRMHSVVLRRALEQAA
jgi:carbon-monoxide dehydrogenase medium subunit